MRKQTKLVAVLSTAALLAIGASMTSFAAQGWAEEDGTWVYYDKNGDWVSESWKKSGDNWYWLDDNGEMAVDMLIEDDDNYYYVNENGAMVTNQWVAIENEDAGEDDEPDHYWYYFQANGKAYKRSDSASTNSISAKVINGKKYAFDTEGRMLYGWVSDGERQTDDDAWMTCEYYFGDEDDGAMSIGWRLLNIIDDNYEEAQPGDEYWDEEQDRWFYFQSSGKKKAGGEKDFTDKTINGKKYGFDKYGRMVASWYTTATAAVASRGKADYTSTFMYFNSPEDGARYTKGWFKVTPGYYLHESKYNDGDEYWYYADGDGEIYSNVIKTIKGKKYAFDEYGRMISGLVFLEMKESSTSSEIEAKYANDSDTTGHYDTEDDFDKFVSGEFDDTYPGMIADGTLRCYYFGGSDDGSMKTGKQNVDIDGDTFTFKFKASSNLKGAGINGMDDDKLYTAGKQIKADKDDKYQVVKVEGNVIKKLTLKEFLNGEMGLDINHGDYDSDDEETTWEVPKAKYNDADGATAKYCLVNSSGTVIKSKSGAKDGDDYKFYVGGSGVAKYQITKVVLED